MKNKNLILALVAFVLAFGSAFSTAMIQNPVWIRAKITQNDPFQCHQLDLECGDIEGNTCVATVTVTKTGSPVPTIARLRDSNDSGATCAVTLQGTSYDLSEFEFYDVVE